MMMVSSEVCPSAPPRSVAVIGPPGSGKSSLLRELAAHLSKGFHTLIMDSHRGDIGGDCSKPHPAIGQATRISLDASPKASSSDLQQASMIKQTVASMR